ncbi:unnamed protein product, partial [marine sediment metagenome]
MDYIDGEDIFRTTKGLPYEEIYPWIVQFCRILEYIHSRGLIHYDIKPGNVLVHQPHDSDKQPIVKLTDFGLAGEHQLQGGTLIRGTFPYIAPEVIKGLSIDHRVDLYSLGVLLYEIFTKRSLRAKSKKSFATLLKQSKDCISQPLSEVVTDIPKWLERVIMRLLAPEPAARFGRANEVIKAINDFTKSKFALETEKTIEGYLLSSRFVGRNKEMELLTSLYEKAKQGDGQVVLITGDAG